MGKKIPKNVKAAAIKAYVADGKTLREVAVEYGVNSESLRRWLGNKVRPRGRHLAGKPSNNPAMRNKSTKVEVVTPMPTPMSVPSKGIPSGFPRANRRWEIMEDELLRDAVLGKMTIKETMDLLGRSSAAIMCRKSGLIESGFINRDDRFVPPTGIKRPRKIVENSMSEPEIVMIEDVKEAPKASSNQNIELSDLARLVKEFGVNVTVSVTGNGMEVKMSN